MRSLDVKPVKSADVVRKIERLIAQTVALADSLEREDYFCKKYLLEAVNDFNQAKSRI